MKHLLKRITGILLAVSMIAAGMYMPEGVYTQDEVQAETTGFTEYDFLQVDGTSIKNNYGQGNTVYLRGTNAGGLFVQENWQNAVTSEDYKTTLTTLISRFGEDTAYELLDLYEENYWTEDDFDNCVTLGMSVIRVPFTYMNLYKYDEDSDSWVLKDNAFDRLDWFVEEASERGIYVILDLHGAFGSQNGQDHSGEVIDNEEDVTFYSDEELMSQTVDLWVTVAEHYAGNPAVAAYDLLNEPAEKGGYTNYVEWNFYDRMYDAIREVDSDHIIIMESCWGTSDIPDPDWYGWENVVYEYHLYPWSYVSDEEGQISYFDSFISSVDSADYGVPTYIGEFTCFEMEGAWEYVLDAFNKNGYHWTSWTYKTTDYGSWGIYLENTTDQVDVDNDTESEIRSKWSLSSIGTGNKSVYGMVYSVLYEARYRTVVFADKALTDDDYFTVRSVANGLYVTAEDYGISPLIANRSEASDWEEFRIIENDDGTYSFQSRANNKYLCAIFDDSDTEVPIIPRSNAISDWEKFYLELQDNGTYAIRTYNGGYYVYADTGDDESGILHADATALSSSQTFILTSVTGNAELPEGNEYTYPEAEGRHEAEDSLYFTQGSSSDTYTLESSSNFSGGYAVGNMNTWSEDGRAYCSTIVDSDTAGTYTLTIGYAGGIEDNSCNIDVRINSDSDNDWVSVEAEYTGGWDTVSAVTISVELQEGENVIDITGACQIWREAGQSWQWVNIDYFDLESDSSEDETDEVLQTTTALTETTMTSDSETTASESDTSGDETTASETCTAEEGMESSNTGESATTIQAETTSKADTAETLVTEQAGDSSENAETTKDTLNNSSAGEASNSNSDSVASSKVSVKKTKVKKALRKKSAKIKVSLKKIANASFYKVQISKKKKFNKKNIVLKKKIKKKASVKKAKFTIKSGKVSKYSKLYIRARAVALVNGKKYKGKWSKIRKIK